MAGAEWLMQQADLLIRFALEPGSANQAQRLRGTGCRSRSAIPDNLRPSETCVAGGLTRISPVSFEPQQHEAAAPSPQFPIHFVEQHAGQLVEGPVPSRLHTCWAYTQKREPKLPFFHSNLSRRQIRRCGGYRRRRCRNRRRWRYQPPRRSYQHRFRFRCCCRRHRQSYASTERGCKPASSSQRRHC